MEDEKMKDVNNNAATWAKGMEGKPKKKSPGQVR